LEERGRIRMKAPEQINTLFAEKIWGWKKSRLYSPDRTEHRWGWFNDTDDLVSTDYTPATNRIQAFETAKKYCKDNGLRLKYGTYNNVFIFEIYNPDLFKVIPIAIAQNTKEVDAICNALIEVLEAK
jgi:hypothetical protein